MHDESFGAAERMERLFHDPKVAAGPRAGRWRVSRKGRAVSGWVILDKPPGLGSTQAVAVVRRAFEAQKAGHAGTLDPLATGILPIALGEATKTVGFLMDADKSLPLHHRLGRLDRQLRRATGP